MLAPGARAPTVFVAFLACGALLGAAPLHAQVQSEAQRISVAWSEEPIQNVLRAFAVFSGKSVVPGPSVTGSVTAEIHDQPWDVVMRTILTSHGLVAVEDEHGIIRVNGMEELTSREAIEPVVTRVYRISYGTAAELQAVIAPLLSQRGSVSSVQSQNVLVVSDIARVQRVVAALLG